MEENKRIKRILFVIVAMYVFLLLFLAYFQISKSEEIASNSYNPRRWVDESKFKRGSIKDRNGETLAESVMSYGDEYTRTYNYGSLFSHITGYSSLDYGKTGLEQSYNSVLLNIKEETPIDQIINKVVEDKQGNNIVTTLDVGLQSKANELLQGHKGSIIVMNPKTGAVYAMISSPTYDPNNLNQDWNNLINDSDSVLLNRSTQGLYTPGSIIKVITAVAIMESGIDLNYNDTGSIVVDGYTINNFENAGHGEINMQWALVHSSNTYFVDKALEIGPEAMENVFRKFMFGSPIEFDLPTEMSTAPFKAGMDNNAFAAASYGQGTTLVSPLQMAMMISAVANDGKMVEPKLVDRIEEVDKGEIALVNENPKVISEVTSPDIAKELQGYLGAVVDNYASASTFNTSSGGKTGTAETASGLNHAWYVGFAPLDDPKFAVCVVLEEDGTLGGTTAAPIGAKMLDEATLLIK